MEGIKFKYQSSASPESLMNVKLKGSRGGNCVDEIGIPLLWRKLAFVRARKAVEFQDLVLLIRKTMNEILFHYRALENVQCTEHVDIHYSLLSLTVTCIQSRSLPNFDVFFQNTIAIFTITLVHSRSLEWARGQLTAKH